MSTNYTIYSKGNPRTLRSMVEGFVGAPLRAPEGKALEDVLHGEVLDVPITFDAAHDIVDDMGIAFSEFPVAVEFARSGAQPDADLREELCRVLALLLGRHLYRASGLANIVVRDSQTLIDRNPAS